MALKLRVDEKMTVTAQPLSPRAFAPFGSVVANPRPDLHPLSAAAAALPPDAAAANQGSAIRYSPTGRVRNLYAAAPSGGAEPVTSLFVCGARAGSGGSSFTVRVLERHPFTTQTFAPLASSAAAYLVVVAPSLPGASGLPAPAGADLPGSGLPDVRGLRAFVATRAQAVTYGAGTWHAPMVALGRTGTTLDLVVFQFASGAAEEDCQLVELEGVHGVEVRIPATGRSEKL